MNLMDPGGNSACACGVDIAAGAVLVAGLYAGEVIGDYMNDGSMNQNAPLSGSTRALIDVATEAFSKPEVEGYSTNPVDEFAGVEGFGITENSSPGIVSTPQVSNGLSVVSTPVSGGEFSITVHSSGSYTIDFPDGTKYHGKGGLERARASARRIARQRGYDLDNTETDWSAANSDREAFKEEDDRIQSDGGVDNPNNHNRINSPGRRYNQEDGNG